MNIEVQRPVLQDRKALITMDVGFACAFLATPFAWRLTGQTLYADSGIHIMA